MFRLCVLLVNFAVLFAGIVNSTDVQVTEGTSYVLFVTTLPHEVSTCHLTTPQNDFITFVPGDESKSTEKYEIGSGTGLTECMLTVRNIDKNDEGPWLMSYDHDGEDDALTETFNFIVSPAEPKENEDHVTSLSMINHFTREEMEIDISLNKDFDDDECYVRPPNGELTKVNDFAMEHVTVQKSSNFVSCRITIGPMSESLLGEWRLCGKNEQSREMICQPANIAWNNNNANANWASSIPPRFSHPVHFGGSINPEVIGTGNVITCHVVTPNDEDLVITSDVTYLHIERIAFERSSLCSIKFTNIDASTIGDWNIYGKFRSSTGGLNEVHLPLRFFLYNEDNPYEQAYNVTELPDETRLVIMGSSLDVDVTSSGAVENCQCRTPTGQTYDLLDDSIPDGIVLNSLDTTTGCRITIDPITEKMLGEWQIIGKFSNRNQYIERQQTFHVIKEDPANPIIDEFRNVENLTEVFLDTELDASHILSISSVVFVENESCHLLTPKGLQYAFIPGFNVPNVEIIERNDIECGVEIDVKTADMLGEWTLIARATRLSIPIERRRTFTIRIEETSSLGNAINITEGADLYLSLPNNIAMYETCKLYGPNDEEITDYEVDQIYYNSCGYIIRNVSRSEHGTWAIVYGNQITYRATVDVNVLEYVEIPMYEFVWNIGSAIDKIIGPEDAIYCRIDDNRGFTVFDEFGPCRIVVDRVTLNNKGVWRMLVGVTGRILLQSRVFVVDVRSSDSDPIVTTSVEIGPPVRMTCSVPIEYEVLACKLRHPTGFDLMASHGVGQGQYTGSLVSSNDSHACTVYMLKISPLHEGFWRCAVHTTRGIYYGFPLVTGMVPSMYPGDHVFKPVLHSQSIRGTVGVAVTMSCSIESAIRYCYFRASNGTVFNVGPSTSSAGYEYVGNGFDSGECGIKFTSPLASSDSIWSCYVGLVDTTAEELRSNFSVTIEEPMWISQQWQAGLLEVRFTIAESPILEYCRFVRIDGRGFTSDNVPSGYQVSLHSMRQGACILTIVDPNILDMHPWTVAAKLTGVAGEMSMTSNSTMGMFGPEIPMVSVIFLWIFFMTLCAIMIGAAVCLLPKKNRQWTYERAAHLRNSFRRQAQPAQQTDYIITDLPPKA